jgi:hypothetical protein
MLCKGALHVSWCAGAGGRGGKFTVTRTFPLAQAQQAQDFVRNGQAIGKTILIVDAARAKSR